MHSHDWVHGIFLCLNGGSAPCQGSSDTALRQSNASMARMDAELNGNIHLKHDGFKSQHVGALKRS